MNTTHLHSQYQFSQQQLLEQRQINSELMLENARYRDLLLRLKRLIRQFERFPACDGDSQTLTTPINQGENTHG